MKKLRDFETSVFNIDKIKLEANRLEVRSAVDKIVEDVKSRQ